MWGAALIAFREVFEIAIIVCVVLAATKDLSSKRTKWILVGIVGGLIGATIFAAITQSFAVLTQGGGKQYFNAAILLVAAAMVAWTVIWMKQHAKTITKNLKEVGKSIAEGTTPVYMLAVVIGLAVLREGSEIVLFLYGVVAAGQATWFATIIGGLIGSALGCLFGLLLYHGLLRISIKYLFDVTSVLLTLIAAGMAANAAGKLVKVGALPALMQSVWDTSYILPQHSWLGRFLYILIGYQEHPNGMQVMFYALTLTMIIMTTRRLARI